MKICDTCKTSKNLLAFNKNRAKKDGLNSICKECSKLRSRKYYKENREKHIKVIRTRNILLQKRIKSCINKIKNAGCQTCSERSFCCIDFHHINEEERENHISAMAHYCSLKKLKEEIEKCCLLCANCHRKFHNNELIFVPVAITKEIS